MAHPQSPVARPQFMRGKDGDNTFANTSECSCVICYHCDANFIKEEKERKSAMQMTSVVQTIVSATVAVWESTYERYAR